MELSPHALFFSLAKLSFLSHSHQNPFPITTCISFPHRIVRDWLDRLLLFRGNISPFDPLSTSPPNSAHPHTDALLPPPRRKKGGPPLLLGGERTTGPGGMQNEARGRGENVDGKEKEEPENSPEGKTAPYSLLFQSRPRSLLSLSLHSTRRRIS